MPFPLSTRELFDSLLVEKIAYHNTIRIWVTVLLCSYLPISLWDQISILNWTLIFTREMLVLESLVCKKLNFVFKIYIIIIIIIYTQCTIHYLSLHY